MLSDWISVKDRLPENGVSVLAVKELKSGQRQIGLAYCLIDYEHYNYDTKETIREPYWVCGGNNNIIYWMPLPEIPTKESEKKDLPFADPVTKGEVTEDFWENHNHDGYWDDDTD